MKTKYAISCSVSRLFAGGVLLAMAFALSVLLAATAQAAETTTLSVGEAATSTVFAPQAETPPAIKNTSNAERIIKGSDLSSAQITEVEFLNNKTFAEDIKNWDVSAAGDKSVMAWATTTATKVKDASGTDVDAYKLSIGAEGAYPSFGTSAESFFADMSNLTTIKDLNQVSTANVTTMLSMFSGCANLTSVDLTNFDTSKVTNMSQMFFGCAKLAGPDFSKFNTANVTNMGQMFFGCAQITELDLSKFDTSKVTYMGQMFFGCSRLATLNIASFDTLKLEGAGNTDYFKGCTALSKLTIGNKTKMTSGLVGNWKNQTTNTIYAASEFPFQEPATYEKTDQAPTAKAMFRLYNKWTQEHFYTGNATERRTLIEKGWNDEEIGWFAPAAETSKPVYRLYNPYDDDHHYTMGQQERDDMISKGWRDEGIGWYSDVNETVTLYREYNPWLKQGAHNYTPGKAEHDYLVSLGWRDEGTAWYGVR